MSVVKHLLFVCCAILAFRCGVAAETESSKGSRMTTPDGRFDTACFPWGEDSSRELCRVSFYRLIASPERYDGKLIAVSGYLRRVFGKPVLFPNQASFEAGAQSEGIELMAASIPRELREKLDTGVPAVLVVGVFDGKYIGNALPMLGALRSIHNVQALVPLPTGP
jgi:hypothetical protein